MATTPTSAPRPPIQSLPPESGATTPRNGYDNGAYDAEAAAAGKGSGYEHISTTAAKPWSRRLDAHLRQTINQAHTDLVLVVCCFCSGLLDSSVYNAWSCFVSMQTGNTIFLALGASNQPTAHPYGWAKSLLAISAFSIGSLSFARTTRLLTPLRRSTLILSFLLQSTLIFAAAALVQSGAIGGRPMREGDPVAWLELLPLGLLAFQSSGQMVTSRALGMAEIPTVVLTSVYCDTFSDPLLCVGVGKNVKRNRRMGGIVSLLLGAIVGGWVGKSDGGVAAVLFVAAGLKLGIVAAWALWKGEEAEGGKA